MSILLNTVLTYKNFCSAHRTYVYATFQYSRIKGCPGHPPTYLLEPPPPSHTHAHTHTHSQTLTNLTHSLIHIVTHSLTHPLTHARTGPLTDSLTHSLHTDDRQTTDRQTTGQSEFKSTAVRNSSQASASIFQEEADKS